MIEINGIAHIQLTVSDMAASVPFYRELLGAFGMQILLDDPNYFYCIGAKTGLAIAPSARAGEAFGFSQANIGLHHVCFRARSREDVDAVHQLAVKLGAKVVHPPQEDGWAPGYYSVLFEDPDGIRLEANFVPGKGHLKGA